MLNHNISIFIARAALAQIVVSLPLVQQVRGSIPAGRKFSFENFQSWGGYVHFPTARLYIKALHKIPNSSVVHMLISYIVMLIAIRPSDGDVKPGCPLGAFREEQAMSRHRVSPSPFLSLHIATLTSTSYSTLYRYWFHTYARFLES